MKMPHRLLAFALSLFCAAALAAPPNIVYIYADDLGYRELGCYGQQIIKTPNLDKLAERGMLFTQHYAGNAVCAPSRCVVMTGYDPGRAYIRNNSPWASPRNPYKQGQEPIPAATVTLAELLKEQGYRTGCVGKWGLGGPETEGAPTNQGFDFFFGYLCQKEAHSYYPSHLWHNDKQVPLNEKPVPGSARVDEGFDDWSRFEGEVYAPQAISDAANDFVKQSVADDKPFFLWYATIIPHAALHIPSKYLEPYDGLDEAPYLGEQSYTPHEKPHAAYAAMITYMDEQVGRLIATLEELGVADNTLIVFSSDNGATFNGGVDAEFFKSVGELRGLKGSMFEGGLRVPMIAAWPGHIAPGSTSELITGQVDMLPTFLAAANAADAIPADIDGVNLLPTLTGNGDQATSEFYYWELGPSQAIRRGDWKLVRTFNAAGNARVYLFNLAQDPSEENNLAEDKPELVAELVDLIQAHRTEPQVEQFRRPDFSRD